ncbi:MAG: hypothetical protein KDK24_17385 [Pseudooceanicola sp.]|nr:hypothetical protein [Pseudooceanicola sp.]
MPTSPATIATEKAALNLRETALLGTLTGANDRKALIRHPGGRIDKVSLGDRVAGATVTAIGDGELHLTRNGQTKTLTLPKG